jgi:predicted TIM-barrel fold metal-dependent hydrolase
MSYADGRVIFDADSHVMEPKDWITPYADPGVREQLRPAYEADFDREKAAAAVKLRQRQQHDDIRPMLAKGWTALGAFDPAERSRALDLLGFSGQLVFSTVAHHQFYWNPDLDVLYGGTRAHNRAMADFCSTDERLFAVGLVPLADPDQAQAEAHEAIELGCRAILIPSAPPKDRSPSHPDFDPLWATLQDAQVPFVLHIGTGGRLVHPSFRNNGRAVPPDFMGGGENIRSKDFLGIHGWPEYFLSVMVLDGVFQAFPGLQAATIEQGAEWIVTMLRRLDYAQGAFKRNEPDLAGLPERASDYVRRQIKATPFPQEDVRWIVEHGGEDVPLFSTDYPHIEGGRDPLRKFEESVTGLPASVQRKFYAGNFASLLALPAPAGAAVSR